MSITETPTAQLLLENVRGRDTEPRGEWWTPELLRCPGHEAKGHRGQGHETGLAQLAAGRPPSKLEVIFQPTGTVNRLEDCFSIHFIQGTQELPSIVKIREKKDTGMLGVVRPVERLMEGEPWLRKGKERGGIPCQCLRRPLSSLPCLFFTGKPPVPVCAHGQDGAVLK